MTDTNQLPPLPDFLSDTHSINVFVESTDEQIRDAFRAYALQARAQVHPAQAEVTPEEVMRAAKEATAPEWQDVVDGWHMGLDLMKFTSLILALRPVQVPMTEEQIDKLQWGPSEGNPMTFAEGLREFARAVEAHHGITAQAKKEGA